jgi:lycopene cyclase domain-containing protein
MNSLYLIIDLGAFIIPFLFSFHPRLEFFKQWRRIIPALLIPAFFFVVWDIVFTGWGVWGFNPRYVVGSYHFGLPVEEYLFFMCIPYSCLFTNHCMEILIQKDVFAHAEKYVSGVLVSVLLVIALIFYDRWYTVSTSVLLAGFLLFIKMVLKANWISRFYFTYLFLLLPFFIVNGLLTGTGPDEPVVWYNNAENMNLRILTIPIEDFFYGMLLLLMNTAIYRALQGKPKHIS